MEGLKGGIGDRVKNAVQDYRYLLNRGYPRSASLNIVSARYILSREERMLLYRCVHPDREAELVRSKLVEPPEIEGQTLIVDGYNVVLTIRAWVRGDTVYLCDDGVVRDLSGVHGKVHYDKTFQKALEEMLYSASLLNPGRVEVFYDKQVSRSGELAAATRRLLSNLGLDGVAATSDRNDARIIRASGVVSSSDIVILTQVSKIFDLAGYTITRLGGIPLELDP